LKILTSQTSTQDSNFVQDNLQAALMFKVERFVIMEIGFAPSRNNKSSNR
jgi:hypothetical protein